MRPSWVGVIGIGLLAAGVSLAEEPLLKTRKDKVSYAMAVVMARTIQRQGVEIDVPVFAMAMQDVLAGARLLMTPEEMRQAMSGVVSDLQRKQKGAEAARAGGEGAKR